MIAAAKTILRKQILPVNSRMDLTFREVVFLPDPAYPLTGIRLPQCALCGELREYKLQ